MKAAGFSKGPYSSCHLHFEAGSVEEGIVKVQHCSLSIVSVAIANKRNVTGPTIPEQSTERSEGRERLCVSVVKTQ